MVFPLAEYQKGRPSGFEKNSNIGVCSASFEQEKGLSACEGPPIRFVVIWIEKLFVRPVNQHDLNLVILGLSDDAYHRRLRRKRFLENLHAKRVIPSTDANRHNPPSIVAVPNKVLTRQPNSVGIDAQVFAGARWRDHCCLEVQHDAFPAKRLVHRMKNGLLKNHG